jgi:hypothetical protein
MLPNIHSRGVDSQGSYRQATKQLQRTQHVIARPIIERPERPHQIIDRLSKKRIFEKEPTNALTVSATWVEAAINHEQRRKLAAPRDGRKSALR